MFVSGSAGIRKTTLVEAFLDSLTLGSGSRVWIGLGAWLFADAPERAVAQLREARASRAAGIALFSWDALAEAPRLRDALTRESAGGG